jgi:hypothetical protein
VDANPVKDITGAGIVDHSNGPAFVEVNAKTVVGAGVIDELSVCDIVQVDARPHDHICTCKDAVAYSEVRACVVDQDARSVIPANVEAINDVWCFS